MLASSLVLLAAIGSVLAIPTPAPANDDKEASAAAARGLIKKDGIGSHAELWPPRWALCSSQVNNLCVGIRDNGTPGLTVRWLGGPVIWHTANDNDFSNANGQRMTSIGVDYMPIWLTGGSDPNTISRGTLKTNISAWRAPCLDLKDGNFNDGAMLQVWECAWGNPNPNQRWFKKWENQ